MSIRCLTYEEMVNLCAEEEEEDNNASSDAGSESVEDSNKKNQRISNIEEGSGLGEVGVVVETNSYFEPLPMPSDEEEFRRRIIEYKNEKVERKLEFSKQTKEGYALARNMYYRTLRHIYFVNEGFEAVKVAYPEYLLGEHRALLKKVVITMRKVAETNYYLCRFDEGFEMCKRNIRFCNKHRKMFSSEKTALTYGVMCRIQILQRDFARAERSLSEGLRTNPESKALNKAKEMLEKAKKGEYFEDRLVSSSMSVSASRSTKEPEMSPKMEENNHSGTVEGNKRKEKTENEDKDILRQFADRNVELEKEVERLKKLHHRDIQRIRNLTSQNVEFEKAKNIYKNKVKSLREKLKNPFFGSDLAKISSEKDELIKLRDENFKIMEDFRMKFEAANENIRRKEVEKDMKDKDNCQICLEELANIAFGCGHLVCQKCSEKIVGDCPFCRKSITHRIKIFRS